MPPDSLDLLPAAYPLIGRDDPAPFAILHEQGAAPALVVCDHASRAFPRGMPPPRVAGSAELAAHRLGHGAAELARGISNALDAPAVLSGYSRLVVDCNRHPDDPEAFR